MNLIFLSPHFPSNHRHYCQRLHDAGVKVLGIDQIPYQELPSELRSCLHDYYAVSNLHHYNELVQACHYFIHRHGPIDRIESHNEHWLEMQALLASEFHISGLTADNIPFFKRKSEMKKIFSRCGLTPARGELVTTLEAALAFSRTVGYPLMFKPNIGVGASGCNKIHDEGELRHFFQEKPPQEYLMEEFIHGDMFSFDGLADEKGQLLFHTAHAYGAGMAEIVRHQISQVYYSLRDIPEGLEAAGRKTLEAFAVRERFFHFEYFLTHKDKKWIPVEVNLRPPGGFTVDMCNFACDSDLYGLWAQLIAGTIGKFSYERKYHCMCASRRHKTAYRHSHQEILEKGKDLIVHHDDVPPIFSGPLGDYVYVARAPHLDTLQELQQFIHH